MPMKNIEEKRMTKKDKIKKRTKTKKNEKHEDQKRRTINKGRP